MIDILCPDCDNKYPHDPLDKENVWTREWTAGGYTVQCPHGHIINGDVFSLKVRNANTPDHGGSLTRPDTPLSGTHNAYPAPPGPVGAGGPTRGRQRGTQSLSARSRQTANYPNRVGLHCQQRCTINMAAQTMRTNASTQCVLTYLRITNGSR